MTVSSGRSQNSQLRLGLGGSVRLHPSEGKPGAGESTVPSRPVATPRRSYPRTPAPPRFDIYILRRFIQHTTGRDMLESSGGSKSAQDPAQSCANAIGSKRASCRRVAGRQASHAAGGVFPLMRALRRGADRQGRRSRRAGLLPQTTSGRGRSTSRASPARC
jgi:hypothetical protein